MKSLWFILIFYASIIHVQAQNAIWGKVVRDSDNQPVIGATVRVLNSDILVSTNENGEFRLVFLSPKGELEISNIGYETMQLSVFGNTKALHVRLKESTTQMEEIVISTGYEALPRERSTGAFDHIDNETFNKQVSTDILSRLEAVSNSLTVDRGTNSNGRISIRGINTLRSDMMGPLIVIDNFPYDGAIENINPNDVENITILKDAAAASIWGARAANGVIVITTKKGSFNQPINVDFNSNIRVGKVPDLSYVQQMSSSDFIDVEQTLFSSNYYNSQINSANRSALSPVVELLIKRQEATPTEIEEIDQLINQLRMYDIRDEFSRHMYRGSVDQQYSLGLRGGSDRLAWTASAGLDNNTGNLDERFQRYNIRLNNTYKPFDKLILSSNIQYTHSKSINGRPAYGEIGRNNQYIYPYARFTDDDGNPQGLSIDVRESWAKSIGNSGVLDWMYYPSEDYKNVDRGAKLDDILLNLGVNYNPLPGLHLDLKYLFERQSNIVRGYFNDQSYVARNMINRFSQVGEDGNIVHIVPYGGILDRSNSVLQANNLRLQSNFYKSWAAHHFTAIAGWELRRSNTSSNWSRLYGYNNENLTFGHVDFTRTYPILNGVVSQFIDDNTGISDNTTNFLSYFANASYTFKEKYSISASGRRDASNLFGLRTNDQWNPFWSLGASWNLSEESFFTNRFVSYLKLRATYGSSGNINPSMVAATTIQYVGTNMFTQSPIAYINNFYDSGLRWEQTNMANFGLDFRLLNQRVSGSIDVFLKKSTDLFGTAVLDYTGGIGATKIKNVADMKGRGVDVGLKTQNIRRTEFSWFTNLNLSMVKDEVVEYHLSNLNGSNFISTSSLARISGVKGKPVYAIYSYRWAGLDPSTGEPRGYLNEEVSTNYSQLTGAGSQLKDLVYHGPANPTVYGSLGNSLAYKSLSLDFAFVYKFGHYFRRQSINYQQLFTNWVGHSDFENRWQHAGDEIITDVPAFVYPTAANKNNFYAGSEVLVERADHIRLQYLNLSYDFGKANRGKLPFDNLALFVNASNLGIVWRANKRGIDPDHYFGTNRTAPPAIYAFGVRANL
nr:SusC/RagA family TonB-linked outer membrane protein [Olivibacter sitiensis]